MNIKELLGILISVAIAVERVTEIVKPIYLKIKNNLLKKEITECTIVEKRIITIILSVIFCIFMRIGIDIPYVNEPWAAQSILAGFAASFGSNTLHTLLTILSGIKDTTETRAARKLPPANEEKM